MKYIHRNFPKLWSEDGNSSKTNDGGLSWVNTMFSVAEEGTFGTLKSVEYENLIKVLFYLQKKKQDYDAAMESKK